MEPFFVCAACFKRDNHRHDRPADSSRPPPISAKGELFQYQVGTADAQPGGARVAFEFDHIDSQKALVCIGGLTDGLLSMRYLPRLVEVVAPMGWRVIQPLLCSSYAGWGLGSLNEDVIDIEYLLHHLLEKRDINEVVLLGHSTGCQDIVTTLNSSLSKTVRGIILQAPVSDREATENDDERRQDLDANRALATGMIKEGHGDECMPREAGRLLDSSHPVTAYRFHSLTGHMTDDDMFSSDLGQEELKKRLGHINIPTLLAFSLDDEYVPSNVNIFELAKRMQKAMGANKMDLVSTLLIEEGGHGLSDRDSPGQEIFVQGVKAFLNSLPALETRQTEVKLYKKVKLMD